MSRLPASSLTLLLGALVAIGPLAMDVYLPSMPAMTQALGATPEQVQLTLSVYMYGWGVAQLVAGPLSDRFGRRPSLLAGLLLFVVAAVVCARAQDVVTLIAARFVQALAMAVVAVVPRAIVRDLHAGDRAAHMLSVMMIVLGLAPVVAPLIGAQLHVWFGWPASFWFVAAYAVVAAGLVAWRLPETLVARNPRALHPATMIANASHLLHSRRYVGYLLVAAFTSCGLFAFLAGSAFVFIDAMGTGERGFGLLFGTVMLGNVTGATLSSRLVMRVGLDRMIGYAVSGMLGAGVAMAAAAWAGIAHPLAIVVPMFVYMVAFMGAMPQATAGALTPFPAIAGSAASLLSFAQFVLAATTALIVGLAFDGSARPMTTAIAVSAVGSFAAFRLLVHRRHVPAHAN